MGSAGVWRERRVWARHHPQMHSRLMSESLQRLREQVRAHPSPDRPRRMAPQVEVSPAIGVTVSSPKYAHLADEAVKRFRKATGLDVVILWAEDRSAFSAKLNLDLLVAAGPVVF